MRQCRIRNDTTSIILVPPRDPDVRVFNVVRLRLANGLSQRQLNAALKVLQRITGCSILLMFPTFMMQFI